MAVIFGKEVTLSSGWQNVLTVMQANGYTGGSLVTEINYEEEAGNVMRVKDHTSGVVAPVGTSDGYNISSKSVRKENCDIALAWIYTDGANPLIISTSSNY